MTDSVDEQRVYMAATYDEAEPFRPVPMRMVTDRIGVAELDWMTYIVIDNSTVMQVASKKLVGERPRMALDFWIGKAVKEHNRLAELDSRHRIDDPANWRRPIA